VQAAGTQLHIETIIVLAKAGDDFDQHFAKIKSADADAVVVQPSLPLGQVAASAAKIKLPATCPNTAFTQAGGLMSYSSDVRSVHREAATIVDKVLKGRKPEDLPVEITTKFRLVVNVKAAKAIGLQIPPLLLTRADEVIE
jgi:putative ABC transport system substrate-binding protein